MNVSLPNMNGVLDDINPEDFSWFNDAPLTSFLNNCEQSMNIEKLCALEKGNENSVHFDKLLNYFTNCKQNENGGESMLNVGNEAQTSKLTDSKILPSPVAGKFFTSQNEDKSIIQPETVSFICNGISGTYETQDQFLLGNKEFNEQEQIVPNNNILDQIGNTYSDIFSGFFNQNEKDLKTENILVNETSQTSSLKLLLEEAQGCCSKPFEELIEKDIFKFNSDKENNKIKEVLDIVYKELLAFTPGGQLYKPKKISEFSQEIKPAVNKNYIENASDINHIKKLLHIQNGIFISNVDIIKEEEFNCWLQREKGKLKDFINKFDIKLNVRALTAERELIKLDRYLKQYNRSWSYVLDVLNLIKKTDIELINLIHVSQVYETVYKMTNYCNDKCLAAKTNGVLKKFKALMPARRRGINYIKYLKELCEKEDHYKINKLSPIEWIIPYIHLE